MRSVGRRAALLGVASAGLGALVQFIRPAHGVARIRTVGAGARNTTTRIAKEIVDGRCGALFQLDDLRDRTGAARLAELGHWRSLLQRTAIHPLRDVARAFVTSTTVADTSNSALVVDLNISDPKVIERELLRIGEPARESCADLITVTADLDGTAYAIAQVGPRTIAAVPEGKLDQLELFRGAAGLPESNGTAVTVFADEPGASLGALCAWPATLSNLEIDLSFSEYGATIDLISTSTSAAQANLDAQALGATVNGLLEVDLLLFEVQVLGPIRCIASGDKVAMFATLGKTELDLLLALGSM